MSHFRITQLLLATQWTAIVAGVSLNLLRADTLPHALREFAAAELSKPWVAMDSLSLAFAGFVLVSSIALFLAKRWGATAYWIASLGGLLLVPTGNVSVAVPIAEFFYQVSVIANGAVLGMLLASRPAGARPSS